MKYPMIAVVGQSGSGKSTSLRNLPIGRTKILNVECKILPFREALKFGKDDVWLETSTAFEQEIQKLNDDKDHDIIIIESGTAYSDKLLTFSKATMKGWDIWNLYAEKMIQQIDRSKKIENKWVVWLFIDDLVELMAPNGSKSYTRRIAVNGQALEKKSIDKEFTLVLFTQVNQNADKSKPATFHFITNNDGTCTAKTPMGMFPTTLMDNDINAVIKRAEEYYGIKRGENMFTQT